LKHCPSPHWQTGRVRLLEGLQPQAPSPQVFGKSGWLEQHKRLETVPPDATHAAAGSGDGVAVGARVAVAVLTTVGVAVDPPSSEPQAAMSSHPLSAATSNSDLLTAIPASSTTAASAPFVRRAGYQPPSAVQHEFACRAYRR